MRPIFLLSLLFFHDNFVACNYNFQLHLAGTAAKAMVLVMLMPLPVTVVMVILEMVKVNDDEECHEVGQGLLIVVGESPMLMNWLMMISKCW